MTVAGGFTVEFTPDDRECRVIADSGEVLLTVEVRGDVPAARRDRISRLIADLLAEAHGHDTAIIAPFARVGAPS